MIFIVDVQIIWVILCCLLGRNYSNFWGSQHTLVHRHDYPFRIFGPLRIKAICRLFHLRGTIGAKIVTELVSLAAEICSVLEIHWKSEENLHLS